MKTWLGNSWLLAEPWRGEGFLGGGCRESLPSAGLSRLPCRLATTATLRLRMPGPRWSCTKWLKPTGRGTWPRVQNRTDPPGPGGCRLRDFQSWSCQCPRRVAQLGPRGRGRENWMDWGVGGEWGEEGLPRGVHYIVDSSGLLSFVPQRPAGCLFSAGPAGHSSSWHFLPGWALGQEISLPPWQGQAVALTTFLTPRVALRVASFLGGGEARLVCPEVPAQSKPSEAARGQDRGSVPGSLWLCSSASALLVTPCPCRGS